MREDLIFFFGTLFFWVGMLLTLRGAWLGVKVLLGIPGERSARALLLPLVVGVALLGVSFLLPKDLGRPIEGPGLPLVWVYMAWPGWLCLAGIGMAIWSCIKAFTGVRKDEQVQGWMAAVGWILASLAGAFLMVHWGWRPWLFRGHLPLSSPLVVGFGLLSVVTVAAMAGVQRFTAARGAGAKVAATLALLTGCVIFGAPLAWQLIASVKEPKDQTSRTGFIWIPRIHQTVDYFDESKPMYHLEYDGTRVLARTVRTTSAGMAELEIERPFSLRGIRFESRVEGLERAPRKAFVYSAVVKGETVRALVAEDLEGGRKRMVVMEPANRKGEEFTAQTEAMIPYRTQGLRWENYTEALEWLPRETNYGLVYLNNTIILVVLNVAATLLSCALVGYGFARLRFPGRDMWFGVMLSTMMLPGAVTMMPQFLIFSWLGWVDTLHPLWAPSLFAGAFNVFLIRQFFSTIPMELEEAARIDGCTRLRTFAQVMLPQIKPALAAIGVWTFMGAWNNFMGPLIYISSPEKMPLVYALAMFRSERGGDIGMLMAFSTMTMLPILLLFFVAQRFFIEGVQLSGLGGR